MVKMKSKLQSFNFGKVAWCAPHRGQLLVRQSGGRCNALAVDRGPLVGLSHGQEDVQVDVPVEAGDGELEYCH